MTKKYILIRNSIQIRLALSFVSHTYVWSCILVTSWSINLSCFIAFITSSAYEFEVLFSASNCLVVSLLIQKLIQSK